MLLVYCEVLENIYSHPKEGHLLGDRGLNTQNSQEEVWS